MQNINNLYRIRFSKEEQIVKERLWKVLCQQLFQKYINKEDTVLDLGAGFCEFINNIQCKKKIAVDLNEDLNKFASKEVSVLISSSTNLGEIGSDSIDIVFTSGFFEHLNSIDEFLQTLSEIHRILKSGGKLIIMCPNIRYLQGQYWDFIDHRLPLTHLSMKEGLLLRDFKIVKIIPKFLPYTTKSLLPKRPLLLTLYLKLPVIWKIFGKQMLVIAQKK